MADSPVRHWVFLIVVDSSYEVVLERTAFVALCYLAQRYAWQGRGN